MVCLTVRACLEESLVEENSYVWNCGSSGHPSGDQDSKVDAALGPGASDAISTVETLPSGRALPPARPQALPAVAPEARWTLVLLAKPVYHPGWMFAARFTPLKDMSCVG